MDPTGGGSQGPNPRTMLEMINRLPEKAVFTVESFIRYVHPVTPTAIAMGCHARCRIEDTLWGRKGGASPPSSRLSAC